MDLNCILKKLSNVIISNIQKIIGLNDINVGSFSGESTRKLAQQCGHIDYYNYVFQPFSNCVHSTWAHVGLHNTVKSVNPLHRNLLLPDLPLEDGFDFYSLILTAKYLDKIFNLFDKKILQINGRSNLRVQVDKILKNFPVEQ